MAPRANWKGYLRLSLVSCPIALYPASSLSEKVSFNRINRKTGNRLKQQNVDSEACIAHHVGGNDGSEVTLNRAGRHGHILFG